MKINRPSEMIIPNFQIVKEKTGKENMPDRQSQQQHEHKNEGDSATFEVTEEKLGAAIEAFTHENAAEKAGLSAAMIGNGPGLKVVLKDGSGAVIRQFTGEEFLKLREATAKDGSGRGKILDQKL